MTKLELKINGEPFEVELHDGVEVTIDHGKLVIRAGSCEVSENPIERRAVIDFVAGEMIVGPIQ